VCGTLWNGCVNEDCGSCKDGKVCVSSGASCCKPETCADHVGQCGELSDGCGGTLDCTCSAGYSCTGNSCCERLTCKDVGDPVKGCVLGPQVNFSDGCGGVFQCSICEPVIK
jgi:hypothetical protein